MWFYFFIAIFQIMSCRYHSNRDTVIREKQDSLTTIRSLSNLDEVLYIRNNEDSVFTYRVNFKTHGDYSLVVETTLISDSIFLNYDYFRGGNQVVLSQSLLFKFKDSVISKKQFPIKDKGKFEQILRNKKVVLPEYVLTELSIKESQNQILYIFYAWGLSNGSKEIFAYYLQNGELACLTKCAKDKCDTIGNLRKINGEFDFNDITGLKSMIIFPPQLVNKNNQ